MSEKCYTEGEALRIANTQRDILITAVQQIYKTATANEMVRIARKALKDICSA